MQSRPNACCCAPFAAADIDDLYAYYSLPAVMQYLYTDVQNWAEVAKTIAARS